MFPLGPLKNDEWSDNAGHLRITRYETDLRKAAQSSLIHPVAEGEDSFDKAADAIPLPQRRLRDLSAGQTSTKPDILFMRYIDYDVQPGKKYRYRIKLILQNPNYNVPEKYLQFADFNKSRSLQTPWSEPSSVVSVAPATKIELKAVNSTRGYALVKLMHFNLQTGDYQTGDFKVERGQKMNFYDQDYYSPVDSSTPIENDLSLLLPSYRKPAAPELVDYVTNTVLLDYHEGNRLPGRRHPTEPSSILVMDGEGNLIAIKEDEHPMRTRPISPVKQIAGVSK